jgi:hypothetical protein
MLEIFLQYWMERGREGVRTMEREVKRMRYDDGGD